MIPGHEAAGTIAIVSPIAKLFKLGDRVILEPGVPCRLCSFCKPGKYNICQALQLFAYPPFDGMLSKYFVIPEDFCVPLPANVALEEGVLVESLAIAIHTCKRAEINPGNSVVVFGAKSVGLLCATVAKTFGATKIVVADDLRTRLDFVSSYTGASIFYTTCLDEPRENARRITEQFSLGHGANIVIEGSGSSLYVKTAIHALRNSSTYVQARLFGQDDFSFPMMQLYTKEIKVKGSFRCGPGDYTLAVDLLGSGAVSVKELITEILSLRMPIWHSR